MLVDGDCYFKAVRAAILAARHEVLIAGWDIDSRVRLPPGDGDPDPAAPEPLKALLCHVVAERPQLRIRILLWDFTLLFAKDREPLPMLVLGWSTPEQIEFVLDDEAPAEASHHEKIVVVDDKVAFCGGIDLANKRWDTSEHVVADPGRVDVAGVPYDPFHDVALMVDGEAARALGDVFRERWHGLGGRKLEPGAAKVDPWPAFVEPDVRDVPVGIARTRAAHLGRPDVREVERLYLRSIRAARRLIYLENQFLTASCVASALVERLQAEPDLEAVLVTSRQGHDWLEEQAMGAARDRFLDHVFGRGVPERTRCLYPVLPGGGGRVALKVHSKAMFVDDRLARIGSSNISNRSMGLDTECDVAIEAEVPEHRAAIARMRNRLIGEHLGLTADAVASGLASRGSIRELVDARAAEGRTLLPMAPSGTAGETLSQALAPLADPERPYWVTDTDREDEDVWSPSDHRRIVLAAFGGLAVIVAIVLAWQYTPLSELADMDVVRQWFEALRRSAWAPVLVPAVYALASLVAFPVTVLIAVTGIIFGPLWGFVYSLAGCLAGGALTFFVGVWFGRVMLIDRLGARVPRVMRFLRKRGVVTVALIRMVPVAPFSVVNVVAGAARVRFRDFMLGTALGMVPGIAVMTLLGNQFRRLWESPDATNIAILGGLMAVWFGLTLLAQKFVVRWRRSDA